MEISMRVQMIITVYAVIVGAVIGIIYDVIRISRVFSGVTETSSQSKMYTLRLPLIGSGVDRKNDFLKFCGFGDWGKILAEKTGRKKKDGIVSEFYKSVVVFIGDILFFFVVSPIFTVFIYYANNGKIRWYLVIGAIIGFLLYYFTIGRLIMLFSSAIVFTVRTIGAYVIYFTLRPVVLLLRLILGFIRKVILKISSGIKKAVLLKKMKKYTEKTEKSVALMVKTDF